MHDSADIALRWEGTWYHISVVAAAALGKTVQAVCFCLFLVTSCVYEIAVHLCKLIFIFFLMRKSKRTVSFLYLLHVKSFVV